MASDYEILWRMRGRTSQALRRSFKGEGNLLGRCHFLDMTRRRRLLLPLRAEAATLDPHSPQQPGERIMLPWAVEGTDIVVLD